MIPISNFENVYPSIKGLYSLGETPKNIPHGERLS